MINTHAKQVNYKKSIIKELKKTGEKGIVPDDIRVHITINDKTIKVYGEICQELAEQIEEDLSMLTPQEPPLLLIDSPGGDVDAMYRIIDSILLSSQNATAVIQGEAASAAGIIALSMPHRLIYPSAHIMLHDIFLYAAETYSNLQNHLHLVNYQRQKFLTLISERVNHPVFDVEEWLRTDQWFTAEDALSQGLAEAIVEEVTYTNKPKVKKRQINLYAEESYEEDNCECDKGGSHESCKTSGLLCSNLSPYISISH